MWQYDSPHYEAAGSLPALSLLQQENPTQPQPPVRGKPTRRLPAIPGIDEIDTVPPRPAPTRDIDEIDTLPPVPEKSQRAIARVPQSLPAVRPDRSLSWTAGEASGSPSAQLIASPAKRIYLRQVPRFNPLDRTRWWLLRPGRIEFILWMGGTMLLIGVTCLLLLISALSFQWFAPFSPAGTVPVSISKQAAQQHNASSATSGPALMLMQQGSLVPGQAFQLRGQGFKASSSVAFYFDGILPLLNQQGLPATTRVDTRGSFESTLWPGTGPMWTPGKHAITTRDLAGGQSASLNVTLAASAHNTLANSSGAKSSTPVATSTPISTPTAGPQSTPVGQPPVTVTSTPLPATPTPSPSPTRTTPTPTPTMGTTPTLTPTVGTTPSPTSTPSGAGATSTSTPPVTPTAAHTGLGNALDGSGAAPLAARLSSVSPLIWVMVACYLLSMMFLGIAGFIHRQRRVV